MPKTSNYSEQWIFIGYDIYLYDNFYCMWNPSKNHVYESCSIFLAATLLLYQNMSQEVNMKSVVLLIVNITLTMDCSRGDENHY